MKNRFTKVVVVFASLLLSASLAFAVEVKVEAPEAVGTVKAVKSAGDKAKASSVAVKDAAKGAAADTKAGAKSAVTDTKAGAKAAVTAAKSKVVDINTATAAELKAIPGLGDAYVAKIIAGRPYANKLQLKSRKILADSVYEQVKDLLVAKQIKK